MLLPLSAVAQADSIRQVVEADLLPQMRRAGIPGYGWAVVQHGRVVYAGGIGLKQLGTEDSVTADTRFQMASITKPLTSALVLRLVRQGRVTLDADVRQGLRSWQLPRGKHATVVTPRLLLQHRAGINLDGSWGYPAGQPLPTRVQFLNGQGGRTDDPAVRQRYASGAFRYSTGGYAILEQYLEDTQGMEYEQLVQHEIFDPLQMRGSDLQQPSHAVDLASGHNRAGMVPGARNRYPFASWNASAADAARFCAAMLDAYHQRDTTWLRRTDVELLLHTLPGSDYGLGWHVEAPGTKQVALFHRGMNRGFLSIVKIYLNLDYAVVLLGNHEDSHLLWPQLTNLIRQLFPLTSN